MSRAERVGRIERRKLGSRLLRFVSYTVILLVFSLSACLSLFLWFRQTVSVCLSVSVSVSVCVCLCLPACLSVCLSVSIYLSLSLPPPPPPSLSVCVCVCVCQSVCNFFYLNDLRNLRLAVQKQNNKEIRSCR